LATRTRPGSQTWKRRATASRARRVTPVYSSETLRRSGRDVWLKAENLQRTGSFKVRGAVNKLSLLNPGRRAAA
jgi:threonine dehydratase